MRLNSFCMPYILYTFFSYTNGILENYQETNIGYPYVKTFIIITQFIFLWLLNELGYFLVNIFHLPIPGNVLGMVLLFLLLLTSIVKLNWVEAASSILIKHLAFFFIPIAVGLMTFGDLFLTSGLSLLIVVIGSIVVGMFVTGIVSQVLVEKKRETDSIYE